MRRCLLWTLSRLLQWVDFFSKIKRKNYMVCVYRLQMAECRNLDWGWTSAMGWQHSGPGLIAQIHIHSRSNQLRDVERATYEDCPKTVFTTPKEFCNFSIVIGGLGTFSHTSLEAWHWGSLAFYLGVWGLGSRKFLDYKSSEITFQTILSC